MLWTELKFGDFSLSSCAGVGHTHGGDMARDHQEPRVPQDGISPLQSRAALCSCSSVQRGGHWPAGEAASVWVQEQNARSRSNEASILWVARTASPNATKQWVNYYRQVYQTDSYEQKLLGLLYIVIPRHAFLSGMYLESGEHGGFLTSRGRFPRIFSACRG